MNPTRLNAPWPTKLDDMTISTRPIVSDWMSGSKQPSGDGFLEASGRMHMEARFETAIPGTRTVM
jgi:hypothetical protein